MAHFFKKRRSEMARLKKIFTRVLLTSFVGFCNAMSDPVSDARSCERSVRSLSGFRSSFVFPETSVTAGS